MEFPLMDQSQPGATVLGAYFNSLTAKGVVEMKGREQENHMLEFKEVSTEDFSEKEDRNNLGAALSGFANAGGGVIVWGVKAKRESDGTDRVIATPGIAKPQLLLSRLTELTGHACSPLVLGVQHRVLAGRGNPPFVATLVPASDSGPHMCMLGSGSTTYRYFFRSGGSFMPMQHFQIADMFGRRARPELHVEHYENTSGDSFAFAVRITNRGRGAAQAPFLQLNVNAPFMRNVYGVDGNRNDGLPVINTHRGTGWLHAGGMDTIIHPTMFIDVGGVFLGHEGYAERAKLLQSHCVITFKAGALGIAPVAGKIEIPLQR
jgi:hypothetical protein